MKKKKTRIPIVLIRGGGDLASGVVLRLHHVGIKLIITELPHPLAVRRLVSFSEAVYQGVVEVEGVRARRVTHPQEAQELIMKGEVPLIVDPDCGLRHSLLFKLIALVDARMTKRPSDLGMDAAPIVIGLGPGFEAGVNCHAVVETNRGHYLGRVIWQGFPEANTGIPGAVDNVQNQRVLRSPGSGELVTRVSIGDRVDKGTVIAEVGEELITAPFDGLLRGLLPGGFQVKPGMKIGDLDPREDPRIASKVSEKSLAIGGGVLEALLTRPDIREALWT